MLILVGSGVIAFEAIRHLIQGTERRAPRRRHRGAGRVDRRQPGRLAHALAPRARRPTRPALEGDAAHLRTDALTSRRRARRRSSLVAVTGADWLDPVVALVVAAAIVVTGVRILTRSSRVLVDEALPDRRAGRDPRRGRGLRPSAASSASTSCARRQAGARRYVDLHVQFRSGTSLEDAHRTAHELQDAIRERLGDTDVLIHLEPEDRVRPGEEITTGERPGVRAG